MGNALDNYCHQIKSSIGSKEVEGKISADDKKKLNDKVEDTLKWLETNQTAEKEEYEEKQKDLESVAMPILSSIGGGMPGGMPGGTSSSSETGGGPTIEEID